MSVRTFRDLMAWQKAMVLAKMVDQATSAMPDGERFGLTSQMRPAGVSIPSNIAERHGLESRQDYLRFLRMARGSLMELQTQLILTRELHLMIVPDQLESLQAETDRVLQGLIRGLMKLQ